MRILTKVTEKTLTEFQCEYYAGPSIRGESWGSKQQDLEHLKAICMDMEGVYIHIY